VQMNAGHDVGFAGSGPRDILCARTTIFSSAAKSQAFIRHGVGCVALMMVGVVGLCCHTHQRYGSNLLPATAVSRGAAVTPTQQSLSPDKVLASAACRLNSVTLGGRSGEELVQHLLKGIFSRLPGRCCSIEIDRRLFDRVGISGPVNLPPPCL
jgi:hypothetical protein